MLKDLLHAAHLAMSIGQKLLELHHAGVSKDIADKLRLTIGAVHDVVSLHHKEYVTRGKVETASKAEAQSRSEG